MTGENEKMKFPIEGADCCPNCGDIERVGQQAIEQLKADKALGEKAFPKGLVLQIPLVDPTRPPLTTHFTIPVLQIRFDVCKKCKTIYCTGADMVQQQAMVQQPQSMKGFGFPQRDARWG